jgi:hypothetical protein
MTGRTAACSRNGRSRMDMLEQQSICKTNCRYHHKKQHILEREFVSVGLTYVLEEDNDMAGNGADHDEFLTDWSKSKIRTTACFEMLLGGPIEWELGGVPPPASHTQVAIMARLDSCTECNRVLQLVTSPCWTCWIRVNKSRLS